MTHHEGASGYIRRLITLAMQVEIVEDSGIVTNAMQDIHDGLADVQSKLDALIDQREQVYDLIDRESRDEG
jgi:hypothetical protein